MSSGRLVWHQLNTSDPDAAKRFYTDLLGWDYKDNDMGGGMIYTEIGVYGEHFGGLVALAALGVPDGTPAHWVPYISSDDVDAGAEQVKTLGGSVVFGPDDIPNTGRFALVADPQGAVFHLFKPSMAGEAPPPSRPKPGQVAWNELLTSDPDGALAFYGALFGWTSKAMPMGEGNEPYHLLALGETQIGGMMRRPDQMPVSAWGVYFEVADIDASYAKAQTLGAMAATEIMAVPGTGRLAALADPQGAMFSIIQQDPM